jgi:hypothetical protein
MLVGFACGEPSLYACCALASPRRPQTQTTNDVLLLTWANDQGSVADVISIRPLTNRTRGGVSEPVPRARAAAALAGDHLVVFGGLDNFTQILDVSERIHAIWFVKLCAGMRMAVERSLVLGLLGLREALRCRPARGRTVLALGGFRTHGEPISKRTGLSAVRRPLDSPRAPTSHFGHAYATRHPAVRLCRATLRAGHVPLQRHWPQVDSGPHARQRHARRRFGYQRPVRCLYGCHAGREVRGHVRRLQQE